MISVWTHGTETEPPLFPSDQAASEFLAKLDGGFLLAYSIGLFGGGVLGDRYDPRVVLSIGMWLSATVPVQICIVGNWFGHHSRGAVMGLWSACASVGNIIGTMISSRLVLMGYQYAFAVNSMILFIFTFSVFFNLKSAPRDIGLPDPIESPDELNRVIEEPTQRPVPISFWEAWFLPGVLSYSLAYACLKLVNYGFFFWLPYYLHSNFGWSESDADALSAWYDVGGIAAAIIAGAISVRRFRYYFTTFLPVVFFPTISGPLCFSYPIVVAMLVCSMFSLWAYSASPSSMVINAILLTVAGFFIGGPANMISSSVSADLGTGSFGAAIGQVLIPSIQAVFGWESVFYGFIVMV
ncbi:transporter, major facilitator family protein, partial [Oesophagostomum dentatum]